MDSCKFTLNSFTSYVNALERNLPANIQLMDPEFNCSPEVDLQLGDDVFFDILTSEKIKLVTIRRTTKFKTVLVTCKVYIQFRL